MINRQTSLDELAVFVSEALSKRGVDAVLTGGAAVVVWTNGDVKSFDLDFVSPAEDKALRAAMAELGFKKRGKDFIHPKTQFFVEFPSGPLAVGQALATREDTVELKTLQGTLRVISPTFCVMDRLAQFFHWGDRSALDQAVAVSQVHPVNLRRIEAWATGEGMAEKYKAIRPRLRLPGPKQMKRTREPGKPLLK